MRHSRRFVPDALGRLEDRVVPSHGVAFINGAAVLTGHAYSKTVKEIGSAFTRFARHGLNFGRLDADLIKAVSRIPYNRVDGLRDQMDSIVAQLRDDIQSGVPRPVVNAYQSALSALRDDVSARVDDGSVVIR